MTRPTPRTADAGEVSGAQGAGFVLVALGALVFSTGPLYRVRSWWDFDDPLAADATVVAVQVLFGLVGLAVVASGERWRRVDPRLGILTALLVAWMASSALWSEDSVTTLRESAVVGATLLAGIGAAVAVGERMLVFAGWVGVHLGLVWSAVLIVTVQPGTQNDKGWTGVYFNPNSLALIAAVGILLSVVLAAQHGRSRGRWLMAPVLAVAVAGDLWLISGTDSLTPLAALVMAVAAVVSALGLRRLVGPGRRWECDAGAVAGVVGIGIVIVAAAAFVTRNSWLDSFGRSTTLTGRTEIWQVAFDWWRDRPITGHGYFGAWADPQFAMEQLEARGELLGSTHNSFIELLLGTGVVGFALAVVLFAWLWIAAGYRALTGRTVASVWPLGVLVFVIVENLAETLWVGGQLVVALVGVLIVVSTAQDGSEEPPYGAPHPPDERAAADADTALDDAGHGLAVSLPADVVAADHDTAQIVRGEWYD